jgi:hypothetical protein
MDLLICERNPDGRFRFVCPRGSCCSAQEDGGWARDRPSAQALNALLAFERLLVQQALPGRPVDPWWVGPASPEQLLCLVSDLAWALTRVYKCTRPVHCLQVADFPVGSRELSAAAGEHWRFAPTELRRCLLAAILALVGNHEIRSAVAVSKWAPKFPDLLSLLGYEDELELHRRSNFWPPAVRSTLHRVFRSPRVRCRLFRQIPRFS